MAMPFVPRSHRRNYAAAGNQAYVGEFHSTPGSADYVLSQSLGPMRDKLRALFRNSSSAKRFGQLLKDNVVGEHGFQLRVRVKSAVADPATGRVKQDRKLNSRVEAEWLEFCEAPTVDGIMDIIELEKMMVRSWASDGEFILEIVQNPTYPDGFKLHPVEVDLLDEHLNTIYPETKNEIRMGVEVDANRVPVAYHFLTTHPNDLAWSLQNSRTRYRRVPADRVIHIYERLRAGQTRGEPPASTVVNAIKMLDGYREAEVTGRRVKSSTMGFVTEMPEAQSGPGSGLDGMADRTVDSDAGEEFQMDLEPGTIKKLPKGYDFRAFDPGGVSTDYDKFEAQVKTDISQGVSISPVSLGYETSKLSYSTHRGIIAEDRDMYRGLQSFFIRMAMKTVFKTWLRFHTLYNPMSSVPPTRVPIILQSFKFYGRGWDYIDPSKDAKADIDQLKARTTSLSRVVAKRGIALEDLLAECADDEALLAEYGLTQNLDDGNSASTPSSDNQEDDATT